MESTKSRGAVSLRIPRLVGTRNAARKLVEDAVDVREGTAVHLLPRDVIDSSSSFVDELLVRLEELQVGPIIVFPASEEFKQQVLQSASDHGYDNVRFASPQELRLL